MALRQSTVSIARIVQRRAAVQNAFRCSVEQNFWADPPVTRAVNARPHQTQRALSGHCKVETGIAAVWSSRTGPLRASRDVETNEFERSSGVICMTDILQTLDGRKKAHDIKSALPTGLENVGVISGASSRPGHKHGLGRSLRGRGLLL